MAFPAFVNSAQGNNYTGTAVPTIATGSLALTAGRLVTVLVRGTNCTGVTDTLGNVYTLRATDPSATPGLRIFGCANCLGGSAVITAAFSPSAAFVSIVAFQLSGAALSSELAGAFTTAAVVAGTTIDLNYNSAGVWDSIVVGIADVGASGGFSFAALGTSGDTAGYVKPVADHSSASFFYRLPSRVLPADTVRATCSVSGSNKRCLVAVFKPAILTPAQERLSQLGAEVLAAPVASPMNVSQLLVESMNKGANVSRLSQMVLETISPIGIASNVLSQWVVETISSVPPSASAAGGTWMGDGGGSIWIE